MHILQFLPSFYLSDSEIIFLALSPFHILEGKILLLLEWEWPPLGFIKNCSRGFDSQCVNTLHYIFLSQVMIYNEGQGIISTLQGIEKQASILAFRIVPRIPKPSFNQDR